VLFDGPPGELPQSSDPRVRQFVEGQAGERLKELAQAGG
jgi:phospholipid/cholesterol/gamma-HCH transport system ATP-binding protein